MNAIKEMIEGLVKEYNYKALPDELSNRVRKEYARALPYYMNTIGDPVCDLYSSKGVLIATGYARIVIGDYGPYIEMEEHHVEKDNLVTAKGQEYRLKKPYCDNIKYEWLTTRDLSGVKIYKQVRGVTYADYRPGCYYVSPYEVIMKCCDTCSHTGQETTDDVSCCNCCEDKSFWYPARVTGPDYQVRVVNLRNYVPKRGETLIKIDRTTPVGNPFPMKDENERGTVCEMYAEWFKKQLLQTSNTAFHHYLADIMGTLENSNVALGCWCWPKRCHGDTIKEYLEAFGGYRR